MAQKRVKEKPKASNRKGRGNKTFEKVAMVDLQQMSLPEIKKIAKRVFNTSNKRIERLEEMMKRGQITTTPAYQNVQEGGGRFSMRIGEKGKQRSRTRNELLKEIKRAYTFMETGTSSEKGAKDFYKKLRKSFEDEGINFRKPIVNEKGEVIGYEQWSNAEIDKFLGLYNELKKSNPKIANRNFKYKYMEEIANNISAGLSPEEVTLNMEKLLEEESIYEQNVEADNGDFFRQLE